MIPSQLNGGGASSSIASSEYKNQDGDHAASSRRSMISGQEGLERQQYFKNKYQGSKSIEKSSNSSQNDSDDSSLTSSSNSDLSSAELSDEENQ